MDFLDCMVRPERHPDSADSLYTLLAANLISNFKISSLEWITTEPIEELKEQTPLS